MSLRRDGFDLLGGFRVFGGLHVALRLKALADPARVKIMSFLFSSSAGEENSGALAA
jgi:hypothetical protein